MTYKLTGLALIAALACSPKGEQPEKLDYQPDAYAKETEMNQINLAYPETSKRALEKKQPSAEDFLAALLESYRTHRVGFGGFLKGEESAEKRKIEEKLEKLVLTRISYVREALWNGNCISAEKYGIQKVMALMDVLTPSNPTLTKKVEELDLTRIAYDTVEKQIQKGNYISARYALAIGIFSENRGRDPQSERARALIKKLTDVPFSERDNYR